MIWFCQTKAAQYLSLGHARQEPVFLLFRPKLVYTAHDQRALNRHPRAVARVYSFYLSGDEARGNAADASTVVALDCCAEEPQLAHLLQNFSIIMLFSVGV